MEYFVTEGKMSTYNFNNPDCDPVELDRRIREITTAQGGSTSTGIPSTGGGSVGTSSNLVYGYGNSLQNWSDVDFKTLFANFPKNSMGVVNGNFMFSFDAAIGWRVNGVDGYFRILFSMMGVATEANIRAQWEDQPSVGIGISSNQQSMDRFEGIFDTISMIYWGDVSTDFSSEPIKNTFGNTQHYLSLHGNYFDDIGLTPGFGGTTDVILSSPTTHYLKKKTFPWAPDWGYDITFYATYFGKPFYVYPSLYISPLHTGYNFGLTINNDGYSSEDWSTFYNDTTLPPQKQLIYNWGFQKDDFKGWNSGQYSAPEKEYGIGYNDDGGCGSAFRVDGGSPFPDPIASKIPDSWNTR